MKDEQCAELGDFVYSKLAQFTEKHLVIKTSGLPITLLVHLNCLFISGDDIQNWTYPLSNISLNSK